MKRAINLLFRFLASTGLAVVLLLVMIVLTFLGTFAQVEHGLYEVQKQYFGSVFLVHWLFGYLPIPLPGAYLVLALVFVNVLLGGVIRLRKGWRHWGLLIAHTGILMLLAGSLVTFEMSTEGQISFFEGDVADTFASDRVWEVVLRSPFKDGTAQESIIPESDFASLREGRSRTFYSGGLPVEVTLSGYIRNAERSAESGPLIERRVDREPAMNVPGIGARIAALDGSGVAEGNLWGMDRQPMRATIGGQEWTLVLRHRTWPLPFKVRLDKFNRELYPGTQIPKSFMSEVTRIEGDTQQPVRISMNEPMRYGGYTFYQASYGPANAGPGDRLYSTLAVVRNPAEQVPLYASLVMLAGLLVHFAVMAFGYLRGEARRA